MYVCINTHKTCIYTYFAYIHIHKKIQIRKYTYNCMRKYKYNIRCVYTILYVRVYICMYVFIHTLCHNSTHVRACLPSTRRSIGCLIFVFSAKEPYH